MEKEATLNLSCRDDQPPLKGSISEYRFDGHNLIDDLENCTQLTRLYLSDNELTDVKGLEKLTQLTRLHLDNNPALTKAQIAGLQKALPKCKIYSNPTK